MDQKSADRCRGAERPLVVASAPRCHDMYAGRLGRLGRRHAEQTVVQCSSTYASRIVMGLPWGGGDFYSLKLRKLQYMGY